VFWRATVSLLGDVAGALTSLADQLSDYSCDDDWIDELTQRERSTEHRHRYTHTQTDRHTDTLRTDTGTDPPLSPLGSDLLTSFLKSVLLPSAIVLLYSMVLTTTSKPTF